MENLNLKKLKLKLLKEVEDINYFMRVEYTVPINWFNDVKEIIYTTMHFAPKDIITKYEISFDGSDDKNEYWMIKIYSKSNKETVQNYLNGSSTRAEKYTVL
jgi:hypothetical protein